MSALHCCSGPETAPNCQKAPLVNLNGRDKRVGIPLGSRHRPQISNGSADMSSKSVPHGRLGGSELSQRAAASSRALVFGNSPAPRDRLGSRGRAFGNASIAGLQSPGEWGTGTGRRPPAVPSRSLSSACGGRARLESLTGFMQTIPEQDGLRRIRTVVQRSCSSRRAACPHRQAIHLVCPSPSAIMDTA